MWYIYSKEHYSAVTIPEFVSFAETWMDLETVVESKIRKSESEKQILYIINTYIWNLEKNVKDDLIC